jgi:hypothetical protein
MLPPSWPAARGRGDGDEKRFVLIVAIRFVVESPEI